MPDYDAGFKIVARAAGRELTKLAGVDCYGWKPIGDTVQATERLADRAFKARRGCERFVVYFEAYTRWQASAPWSVLAKSGLLAERERLPVLSLVFILRPRGYLRGDGQHRLEVAGEPVQQVWFREVCLWDLEPQPWWDESPGLMALYPLCDHQRPRRDAVAYPAQKINERVADAVVRADLLAVLGIFGKLVYPSLDVFHLIGREQMKESKFYQEIQEEARAEQAQADVRKLISLHFGAEAAEEFKERLREITDPEHLSQLLELAYQSRRLADFRRAFASLVEAPHG